MSGKLRGQRAKSMKFVDGIMIHSGQPVNEYIQQAVRHVQLRQGLRLLVFGLSKFFLSNEVRSCQKVREVNYTCFFCIKN